MTEITLDDIAAGLRSDREGFGANLPATQVVLRGGRGRRDLPSGIQLQLQDTVIARDLVTYVTRQPGVMVHLVLEGRVEGMLGQEALSIGPQDGQGAELHLSALGVPMAFRRKVRAGQVVRKLALLVSWEWLAARGFAQPLILNGQPHRQAVRPALAEDILAVRALLACPPQDLQGRALLEAERLAHSLLVQGLAGGRDAVARLSPVEEARLARVERMAQAAGPLPALGALAEEGGVSVSTLRRLFRRRYGLTVHDRLRQIRLEAAAQALRQGHSVAQAAGRAGYASPTAFATAFRRQFGQSPSDYR
ncbi:MULTISPECIES: helix-turn-helix transcriptional regulator [Thioclava]|uniref:Helix-turn-helix transcriptional regulator n=1 Tax=Thioclava kandeliae TaxID=3070818 RepID=A0ABV1SHR8_9RHOB